MVLFPGLPHDMGLECLARLPFQDFPSVSSVCRSWKRKIELPEFWRNRRNSGQSRKVIVLAQARTSPARETCSNKSSAALVYRLTVCEPETGYWAELPPPPGHPDGLPMFCRLAAAGPRLVVVGGLDTSTWAVSSRVLVYDFLSAAWRTGAPMPGPARSLFACGSGDHRTVFVAGGHDGDKRALRSALAYDVKRDEWACLPDMSAGRDEPAGVSAGGGSGGGGFVVVGGYPTEEQGRFRTCAERLDGGTWRWGPVEEDFLESGISAVGCTDGGDGPLVVIRGGEVAVREGAGWRVVGELPAEVRRRPGFVAAWGGKVAVIGEEGFGVPYKMYVLDLERGKWERVEAKEEFLGHVQAGCCLEL